MSARTLLRRSLPLVVALGLTAPSMSAVAGEIGTPGRVDHATTYLARHQNPDGSFPSTFGSAHASTADAVLSLVASGQGAEDVEEAMDWLEANVAGADNLGKKAKVVMAAVAAGRDPRDFGGQNLVTQIQATLQGDGRYESFASSQVFDQSLVLLALAAADATIPRAAVRWLADAQCPDGGWQFDQPRQAGENRRCRDVDDPSDFVETDTNTTGMALQALAAVPRSVPLENDPFQWIEARRDPVKGGWGFDRTFFLTDSLSTSIVLQALAAYDRRSQQARKALRALQRYCIKNDDNNGGFSRGWEETNTGYRRDGGTDLGNTVGAILGLLQKPLPIAPKPFLRPQPEALPCDPVP
jgi:hypothetical protein